MAKTDGHELDWTDLIEVEDEESFVVLPAGEGTFVVKSLEKCTSKKGGRMLTLKLTVTTADGTTGVTENLLWHTNLMWKIGQFFVSIGQRKHGEKKAPNWEKIVGSKGNCKIVPSSYDDEKSGEKRHNNKIDKFLDPNSSVATVADPAPLGDDAF